MVTYRPRIFMLDKTGKDRVKERNKNLKKLLFLSDFMSDQKELKEIQLLKLEA